MAADLGAADADLPVAVSASFSRPAIKASRGSSSSSSSPLPGCSRREGPRSSGGLDGAQGTGPATHNGIDVWLVLECVQVLVLVKAGTLVAGSCGRHVEVNGRFLEALRGLEDRNKKIKDRACFTCKECNWPSKLSQELALHLQIQGYPQAPSLGHSIASWPQNRMADAAEFLMGEDADAKRARSATCALCVRVRGDSLHHGQHYPRDFRIQRFTVSIFLPYHDRASRLLRH